MGIAGYYPKLAQSFLIKMGVTTQEEVDRLYKQASTAMLITVVYATSALSGE